MVLNEIIKLENVKKSYKMGDVTVEALKGINLTIYEGEFVAIMGASGSGKSTLMNIIGCLDSFDSGKYFLSTKDISTFNKKELAKIRNSKIGFVFQSFNLLSRTTALENVELPLYYGNNIVSKEIHKKALEALKKMGLAERIYHFPNQLSGGQQQRVAIARAIVNDPPLILADEPTGALDSTTSIEIMNLFCELNERGKTIILVTHELDIARYSKRIIRMKDGIIISDEKNDSIYKIQKERA